MNKEEIAVAIYNLKYIRKQYYNYQFTHSIDLAIKALEERPTGEWLENELGYYCSRCGMYGWCDDDFCSKCGAKMKMENELKN